MTVHSSEIKRAARRFGMPIIATLSVLFIVIGAVFCGLSIPDPLTSARLSSLGNGTSGAAASLTADLADADAEESSRNAVRMESSSFSRSLGKDSVPVPTIDWKAATGKQPQLSEYSDLSIDVSLSQQTVDVLSGIRVIYTMIASTGMEDSTPHGDFTIGTRGQSFYNANEKMGANWWTGFIASHYLFHSVPTDIEGNYIESEAEKLGNPASHGCVHLTVADAQWFFTQVPSGTPVHIG